MEIKDIKKSFLEINNAQKNNFGLVALYDFLENFLVLSDSVEQENDLEGIKNNNGKEGEDIVSLYNEIKNIGLNIEEQLKSSESKLELVKNQRKEICEILNSLSAYDIEIDYIFENINYYIEKRYIKDKFSSEDTRPENSYTFFKNIYYYLNDNIKDQEQLNDLIFNIVKILPFRITKYKFSDIIGDSLKEEIKGFPKKAAEFYIEKYKIIFNGTMERSYGVKFDNYFRRIEEFKVKNYEQCSNDELKKSFEDLTVIKNSITDLIHFVGILGILINKLIVIFSTKDLIKNNIDEKILSEWALYWNNNQNNKEHLITLLKEKSKDVYDNIKERAKNLEKLDEDHIFREKADEELNRDLIIIEEIIYYLNDMKLDSLGFLPHNQRDPMTLDDSEQITENFIQYIFRNLPSNNVQRKIRMRNLMAEIPYVFNNIDDLMSYINIALDSSVTSYEEAKYYQNILYAMVQDSIEKDK
ncbi:hypothetical protein EQM13_12175 [Acidilutibacter cellobiosedens]|uniref:Uncharacterized protein n=1 Tax=Acidilutibacter cellobiosedens TaxID=2507161 RepID=A0A410QEN2_9FIRM|nr:hypothetical protein [Acidilutibacter cellobiosedens]QAT62288.1 hypothetical protein EQM13_12175 [Acidilutibacter cellobiosedens]